MVKQTLSTSSTSPEKSVARSNKLNDLDLRPSQSQWRLVIRSMRRDKAAILGFFTLVVVIIVVILASFITPYDPLEQSDDPVDYLTAPTLSHPMGTDELRRDILARVLYGGRITLRAGFFSVIGAAMVGLLLGVAAGYYGGHLDEIIGRLIDIILAIPGILLAIVIVAILGPSLQNAMLAVAVSFIPMFARLVRGVTFTEKNKDYILAAKAIGGSNWHIIFKHVLPNVIAPVIVIGTLTVASAIQITAGLGFLGLGAQPPQPEWGAMLSNGRNFITTGEWWMTVFPGLAIFLVVLAINLFGDGLRDALDPRLRNL
jgi:peptide/nickel transport system permease protein